MRYFNDVIELIFDQNQQIVKSIKTNIFGFEDETVGVADTKEVISYHLNSSNKVDRIYLSVSHELMDLE